ncbi:hypothetical protein C6A77_24050 [Pseudomonas sp. AFG_SD02_1510_Pfu_092]|nr:hypothetical protein C6A77_24050 [Pseudomonas sp. AFG_SD02_1510_Pfu_092]
MGAGSPAKQATRCMVPAAPVFAATAAPTGSARGQRERCTTFRLRAYHGRCGTLDRNVSSRSSSL